MIVEFFRSHGQRICRLFAPAAVAALLAGCAGSGGSYHSVAYAPASTGDVSVKVSLGQQMVYVMEGNRCLMATPTCVGRPGFATPTGHFHVTDKVRDKRSSTYGYWVRGSEAHPGTSSNPPPGGGWSYVGYPLAFWVEFAPGFGFHEGPIWPYPRSHGCLHLHESASAKFSELVQVGDPVDIEQSQPEDETVGRTVSRPTDYADPDPPAQLMISRAFFDQPRDTQLLAPPSS